MKKKEKLKNTKTMENANDEKKNVGVIVESPHISYNDHVALKRTLNRRPLRTEHRNLSIFFMQDELLKCVSPPHCLLRVSFKPCPLIMEYKNVGILNVVFLSFINRKVIQI